MSQQNLTLGVVMEAQARCIATYKSRSTTSLESYSWEELRIQFRGLLINRQKSNFKTCITQPQERSLGIPASSFRLVRTRTPAHVYIFVPGPRPRTPCIHHQKATPNPNRSYYVREQIRKKGPKAASLKAVKVENDMERIVRRSMQKEKGPKKRKKCGMPMRHP